MAHPKSRISKQRKRKRRTHKNRAEKPNLVACPETGERHLRHRAFWLDGNLYYRGQILVKGAEEAFEE